MTKFLIAALAATLSYPVLACDSDDHAQKIKNLQQQLESEKQNTEHLQQQQALQAQIDAEKDKQKQIGNNETTAESKQDDSGKSGFVEKRNQVEKEVGRIGDQVVDTVKGIFN